VTGFVPPTERQWGYMFGLAGERLYAPLGASAAERLENLELHQENRTLDRYRAMELIELMKVAPLDLEGSLLQPGAYRRNGEVFVVVLNRDKTNLYCKRIQEIGGRRLTEANTVVKFDYVYAPGVKSKLKPEHRLTWEEAKPLVVRYGMCLFGHPLKDAKSVELGIGPVCRRMFPEFRPTAPAPADPAVRAGLADLLTSLGGGA